jgi:hypothetical protein
LIVDNNILILLMAVFSDINKIITIFMKRIINRSQFRKNQKAAPQNLLYCVM